jgi:hypothetical protein
LREGHGITELIRDAERLCVLLLLREADHLGRDIDADHLRRSALLEQTGIEAEAAGQIQDALPGERPDHAQDRIAFGPFQRRRPGVLVVFAADMVILRSRLRHACLLVFVPLTCSTFLHMGVAKAPLCNYGITSTILPPRLFSAVLWIEGCLCNSSASSRAATVSK